MNVKESLKWLLSTAVAIILERLLNLLPIETLFATEKWDWLVRAEFSFLSVVLFLLLFALVFIIIQKLTKGEKRTSKLEKHLERVNQLIDVENGFKVTWDMYISTYDNDPHPCNIKVFCTKHEFPLLMDNGRCCDFSCPNADRQLDMDKLKLNIRSLLLAERDKFLNK